MLVLLGVARCTAFLVNPRSNVLSVTLFKDKKLIMIDPIVLAGAKQHDKEVDADLEEETDIMPVADNATEMPEPPSPLLILAAYLAFVSFWPLLAYVRQNFNFDIDTFMTLSDMMDGPDYDPETIMELPKLSPAEKLVDALFGPPGVDHRGF